MDQPGIFEYRQRIQQLCHKDLDKLSAQPLKLILFDQFIEIGREELKDKTEMAPVNE